MTKTSVEAPKTLMINWTLKIHSGFRQAPSQWHKAKRRPCCYLMSWTLAQQPSAQLSWTRLSCLRTHSHMHALEFYLQIPEHHSYVPRARPPATIKNASAACWLSRVLINTALYYIKKSCFAKGCKRRSGFNPHWSAQPSFSLVFALWSSGINCGINYRCSKSSMPFPI